MIKTDYTYNWDALQASSQKNVLSEQDFKVLLNTMVQSLSWEEEEKNRQKAVLLSGYERNKEYASKQLLGLFSLHFSLPERQKIVMQAKISLPAQDMITKGGIKKKPLSNQKYENMKEGLVGSAFFGNAINHNISQKKSQNQNIEDYDTKNPPKNLEDQAKEGLRETGFEDAKAEEANNRAQKMQRNNRKKASALSPVSHIGVGKAIGWTVAGTTILAGATYLS